MNWLVGNDIDRDPTFLDSKFLAEPGRETRIMSALTLTEARPSKASCLPQPD